MQSLAMIVVIGLCSVTYCKPVDKYTTKYDKIDLDAVIRNDRLLGNYVDCMLERKKCPSDGAELKRNIPDALRNDCSKCSAIQRNGTKKILTHLLKNKRGWFIELEAKYDPTHTFRQRYDAEIKMEGVKF